MESRDTLRTISRELDENTNQKTISVNGIILGKLPVVNKGMKHKKTPKFTCKQKVALIMMCIADFMSFCSMSIMAPFYPLEAASKGMTESMAGIVFGYYALVVFLSSPVFGKIIPKIGAKFLYISGLMISGICASLFGTLHFIEDYNLFTTLSFLIRGFEALAASAYTTACYVIISKVFPEHSGTVRGLLETFVGLGMSAGPGIGGILFAFGGFGLPFYVIGATMVIISPLNIYLLPTADNIGMGTKTVSLTSLLKLPSILVTCFIIIIVSMTWGFLDPTLEPHLRKFSLTPGNVGVIFLLLSASYGICCPLWGWLTDKLQTYWWLMTIGFFASSIVLLLIGPSPLVEVLNMQDSVTSDIICLLALGVFVSMCLMPTYQLFLDSAQEAGYAETTGTHAVIAGLWSSVYSLGEVLGPISGGYLMESYGFEITSTVFAGFNMAAFIFCTCYFMNRKRTPIVNFLPVIKDEVKPELRNTDVVDIAVEKCISNGHIRVENIKTK